MTFRAWVRPLIAGVTLVAVNACDSGTRPIGELRFVTQDFVVRVSSETRPTRALDPITWRVIVHDKNTGRPIENGEGRVFATNKDGKTVANGLEKTGELGTYRTNLMYVTAGQWAMAIQFRRDSTQALQKTEDWTQDILAASEPGDFTTPRSSPTRDTVLPPDTARRDSTARRN